MGLFGALSRGLSSPVLGGITQGLVQDQRRAYGQSQINEEKTREQAERDFASAFTQALTKGDVQGAERLMKENAGRLSPQTVSAAGNAVRGVKSDQMTQATTNENSSAIAQAVSQGATPEEGQQLAEAGRAGAGLAGIMATRRAVEGRAQQANAAGQDRRLDLMKKLSEATQNMSPEQKGGTYKEFGIEAPGDGGVGGNADDLLVAKKIMAQPSLFDKLTSKQKEMYVPMLVKLGFTFPRPMTDSNIARIADYDTSITMVSDLVTSMEKNKDLFGPVVGYQAMNPYATEAKTMESEITVTKQIVGKALEGGVLRAEDERKYAKILPSMTDSYVVAQAKAKNLTRLLQQSKDIYEKAVHEGKMDASPQQISQEVYRQLPNPDDGDGANAESPTEDASEVERARALLTERGIDWRTGKELGQ